MDDRELGRRIGYWRRRRVAHAWAAFEFADYQVMGSLLPGRLEDAQRTHGARGSQEPGGLPSEVYQVIASTLRKLGEHTLAWLAGDRGMTAEQIAAPEVRCQPLAQATIADLLHRSRGTPPAELARLAEKAGVRA